MRRANHRGRLRLPFRIAGLLVALGLVTWARPLDAQVVRGRVIDAESGEAVPEVGVLAMDTGALAASTITGSDGRFELRLPGPGTFLIRASRQGYQSVSFDSVSVGPAETVELPDIRLIASPIVLDAVRTVVPRSRLTPGNEWIRQRQLSGKGRFFAGAMLAALDPPSLTRHLADEMGFWVSYNMRGEASLVNPGICTMVFLNQWPLNRTFVVDGFVERTGWLSLDDIPIENIAAIEIYEDTWDVPGIHHITWAQDCTFVNVWTWDSY